MLSFNFLRTNKSGPSSTSSEFRSFPPTCRQQFKVYTSYNDRKLNAMYLFYISHRFYLMPALHCFAHLWNKQIFGHIPFCLLLWNGIDIGPKMICARNETERAWSMNSRSEGNGCNINFYRHLSIVIGGPTNRGKCHITNVSARFLSHTHKKGCTHTLPSSANKSNENYSLHKRK